MRIQIVFDSDKPYVTDPDLLILRKSPEGQFKEGDYLEIILIRLKEGHSGLDALGFCGATKI